MLALLGGDRLLLQHWEAKRFTLGVISFGDALREPAHATDEPCALRHADRAASIEHVELMRRLHDEVVGRKDEPLERIVREREEALRFLLVSIKRLEVRRYVGLLEVVRRP